MGGISARNMTELHGDAQSQERMVSGNLCSIAKWVLFDFLFRPSIVISCFIS